MSSLSPYADELSADEMKILEQHLTGNEVPPADNQDGAPEDTGGTSAPSPTPAPAPAPAPAAAPAPTAPAAPADAPADASAQADGQTDDQKFAAFLEQHKGKSPEDLARLAFQQTQRASTAGFQQRQTQQTLEQIQQRVADAAARAQAVRDGIAAKRTAFADKLDKDPDAATREVHERILSDEEQAVERALHDARVEAAVGIASAAIPEFNQVAPQVMNFGAEMGYNKAELDGISDGRDLVVLTLAHFAGNLIKAGIMDNRGQLIAMPNAIEATDPRFKAPIPPATLSSAPARTTGGGKTAEQMGNDLLNLSDDDWAKLPPGEVEALLKQLQG